MNRLFCLKWDPCKLQERREKGKGVFRSIHPHTPFLGQCPPPPRMCVQNYGAIGQKYTSFSTFSTLVIVSDICLRDPSTCTCYLFYIKCSHFSKGGQKLQISDLFLTERLEFTKCWQIKTSTTYEWLIVWLLCLYKLTDGHTFMPCAANMGNKISLLVYQWTLVKCKISYYMNGLQNFPKFESKLHFFLAQI